MKRRIRVLGTLAALLAAGCAGWGDRAAALTPDCGAVQALSFHHTVLRSATRVAAGAVSAGSTPMPEHCLIKGEINPRTGVNGVRYGIHFELRLPLKWNGRFQFQGGGGVDGVVREAFGTLREGVTPALAQGAAVISSDMGHTGTSPRDATFGLDPQARIDWGYNAVDQTTQLGKAIVERFYGMRPRHSYYVGCSGGGRQGMMASQRLPQHFDGVVSGAPILEQHAAQVGSLWGIQAFAAIAPTGADGRPVLSRAYSDSDRALIVKGLLKACDALDGVADGLIENHQACRFDPAVLQCTGARNDSCLSAAQVNALTKTMAGPRNSRGEQLYPGIPWDTSIGGATWRRNWLGTATSGAPNAARATNQSIRYVFMTPPQPDFDYFSFNFDTDVQRLAESAKFTAATGTDYRAFRQRGAKTIVFVGLGDSLVNPAGVNRWYRQLVETNGGLAATQQFARLYNVPGMEHCSGGSALDVFDPVTPLYDWVEKGVAPTTLMATGKGFPGRQRGLCPYPQFARYVGVGNVDDAENFRCEEAGR